MSTTCVATEFLIPVAAQWDVQGGGTLVTVVPILTAWGKGTEINTFHVDKCLMSLSVR